MADPTQRFSDRVDAYRKYRPSYPRELVQSLVEHAKLGPESVIAEIGSGTGIFTELLLENGFTTHAVEPNEAMREAAEHAFADNPRFISHPGSAEQSGLPNDSVDLVVAAQAFHWFDPSPTRAEIRRILKQNGSLALVWNERLVDESPFLRECESLLRSHATDYNSVNHANISDEQLSAFFAPHPMTQFCFPNRQHFDWEGLKGRCLSSSYIPGPQHPGHKTFFEELSAIYERNVCNGRVTFEYQSKLYFGSFS